MRTDPGKRLNLRRMRGVSMIELLTVVVVVAMLATISVQSYRGYLVRAHRTDATTALLRIQVAEEKYFLQNNSYTTDLASAPPTGLGIATVTQNGYYNVAVAADANSTNKIATSFVATATATGGQTKDTACQTLTLNDQGQKGPTQTAVANCWK
jgi:type IV pilus assembly protein PilE